MNWNFHWTTADTIEDFWSAIKVGDVDKVRELIAQNPKIGRWERGDGVTPLDMYASSHNASDELIDLLMALEWNAFGLQPDPVFAACRAGNLRSLRGVISRGFDINGSPRAYGIPLHIAAEKGHLKAIEYLLQHGADPGREDIKGRTATEVAEEHGRVEAADLLRKHAVAHRTPFIRPDKVRNEVTLNILADEPAIRQMIHNAVTNCIAHEPANITAVALHGSGYQGFVECGFESCAFDPEQPDCGADVSLRQMARCDFAHWSAAYSVNNRVSVEYGAKKPVVKTAWGATCEALDAPYFRLFKSVLKSLIKERAFEPLPLTDDCQFGVQTFFHHHCQFWKRTRRK